MALDHIFQLQDKVLREHLAREPLLREGYDFLSKSVLLNGEILDSIAFDGDKQTAIRYLAVDALSHTLVAIRIGLWGDLPESLTILRSALESCAQLQFVVRNEKYKTAVYEMDRKFERISYKTVVAGLGDLGERIDMIHGRISEVAAHATSNRLAFNSYEREGTTYFRFGYGRDQEKAALALFYCMDTCMMVGQAFYLAHAQQRLEFRWLDRLQGLNNTFTDLRSRLLERFEQLRNEDE